MHSQTAVKPANTHNKGMPAGRNPGLKADQSAYGGTEHLAMVQVSRGSQVCRWSCRVASMQGLSMCWLPYVWPARCQRVS